MLALRSVGVYCPHMIMKEDEDEDEEGNEDDDNEAQCSAVLGLIAIQPWRK